MNNKKINKKERWIIIGLYLSIVLFFVVSILLFPKWGEAKQNSYINRVEAELYSIIKEQAETALPAQLSDFREKYPMEIAIRNGDDTIIYQSITGVPFESFLTVTPIKSHIFEARVGIKGKDTNYEVVYSIYQMDMQATVQPYFNLLIMLIALIGAVLVVAMYVMRRQLMKPLENVKDSISKLNRFELNQVAVEGDDIINLEVESFAGKLDSKIQAVNRSHTELEYALQLERERLANLMDISRGIVHDLKTPITQLLFENDIALKNIEEKGEVTKKVIENNSAGLERIILRVNEALKLMRTDYTQLVETVESFDFASMYFDIMKSFKSTIKNQMYYIDANVDMEIETHQNKVVSFLIVHNILTNTFKYAPAGTEVSIELFTEDENVAMKTINEATKNDIQRMKKSEDLFLAELDEASSDNRYMYSTGNGLYLIKELVKVVGGSYQLIIDEERGLVSVEVRMPQYLEG